MRWSLFSAFVTVGFLGGCASSQPGLPFFTPGPMGGIDKATWWPNSVAPQDITIALPTDIYHQYSTLDLTALRGKTKDIFSRLSFKRLGMVAHPQLMLDYADYAAAHPTYQQAVNKFTSPKQKLAASDNRHIDMLINDVRMQFIGSTHEERLEEISTIPAASLGAAEVLALEPKGDFVLDNGVELYKLTNEGKLVLRIHYRVAERATGQFVTNHTCTATSFQSLKEKDLQTKEGMLFLAHADYTVNRICEEAARRDMSYQQ